MPPTRDPLRSLPALTFATLLLGVELVVLRTELAILASLPRDALLIDAAWRRAWEASHLPGWMSVNIFLGIFLCVTARHASPRGRWALLVAAIAAAGVQWHLSTWTPLPPPDWRVVHAFRLG